MKKLSIKKRVLFSLFLLLTVYVIVEFLAFMSYLIMKKQVFSFIKYQSARSDLRSAEISQRPPEVGKRQDIENIHEVLHPYLGFVHDPNKMPDHSEYGFPFESPLTPVTDTQLIVGVFGGSFARQFARGAGKDALITELRRIPEFSEKEIIVRTMALEGYKQPQQFLTLGYFLTLGAHFDIVINLDGFNEVALPPAENIPQQVFPYYPRSWLMRVSNFSDPDMLMMFAKMIRLHEQQQTWAEIFSAVPLQYSVFANLLWGGSNKWLESRKTSIQLALQQYAVTHKNDRDYIATGPAFRYKNDAELYDALAELWMQSSLQMHNLCSTNGIKYYHFLQPNQYLSNSKSMTAEEAAIAILADHPYKEGVEKGYSALLEKGRELFQQGVAFYDISMIFANNTEVLYKDNCCHLNEKGYALVGAAIGDIIVQHSQN